MDDSQKPKTEPVEPRGSFMDVRPRQYVANAAVKDDYTADKEQERSAIESNSGPQPPETPDETAETPELKAPSETKPKVAAAPAEAVKKPGLSPELLAKAEAETKGHGQHDLLAAHASGKNRGPLTAIMVAIVIALTLAGVAGYAYLQSQDTAKDNSADTNQPNESNTPQTTPATSKEVEDMAKELDDTINAPDESQEIPGAGLDEQSVGL